MLEGLGRTFQTVTSIDAMMKWAGGGRAVVPEQVPVRKSYLIDLGTATVIGAVNGEYGKVEIRDADGKNPRFLNHFPNLVARPEKKLSEDINPNELGLTKRVHARMKARRVRKFKCREESEAATGGLRAVRGSKDDAIVAWGLEAFQRWGRRPDLIFERAVRGGNIGYVDGYRHMLRYAIKVLEPNFDQAFVGPLKPRIVTGVPGHARTHHLQTVRSIIETDIQATAVLVKEQIAAMAGGKLKDGSRIPFRGPKCVGLVDIGGGSADYALGQKGAIVRPRSYETAGDQFNDAIRQELSDRGLMIDYPTAIEIKEQLGSAIALSKEEDNEKHLIYGSSSKGLGPGELWITRKEIRACLMPVLEQIARDFIKYLETVHEYGEISGDLKLNGFYLTGGSSQLYGLADYLAKRVGIPIELVLNPFTSVIDGLIEMDTDDELLQLGLAL